MSEPRMVQVQFSVPFLRRLKDLTKRYRKIGQDIQPIIDALEEGDVVGDQIAGTGYVVFKVRAKNSDNQNHCCENWGCTALHPQTVAQYPDHPALPMMAPTVAPSVRRKTQLIRHPRSASPTKY
jgi:hypothetical protein